LLKNGDFISKNIHYVQGNRFKNVKVLLKNKLQSEKKINPDS